MRDAVAIVGFVVLVVSVGAIDWRAGGIVAGVILLGVPVWGVMAEGRRGVLKGGGDGDS